MLPPATATAVAALLLLLLLHHLAHSGSSAWASSVLYLLAFKDTLYVVLFPRKTAYLPWEDKIDHRTLPQPHGGSPPAAAEAAVALENIETSCDTNDSKVHSREGPAGPVWEQPESPAAASVVAAGAAGPHSSCDTWSVFPLVNCLHRTSGNNFRDWGVFGLI